MSLDNTTETEYNLLKIKEKEGQIEVIKWSKKFYGVFKWSTSIIASLSSLAFAAEYYIYHYHEIPTEKIEMLNNTMLLEGITAITLGVFAYHSFQAYKKLQKGLGKMEKELEALKSSQA